MREGSLDAPTRHPIDWQSPAFYDEQALDTELRRAFDICHGCRRCFNLCDSFPKLFELVDGSPTEELDSVDSKDFGPVVDACTLCDMCFMAKCPYVPPHEFNLDFPHLMLRAKAVQLEKGERSFADTQLAQTDRNGKLGSMLSGVANFATKIGNGLTRGPMSAMLGVDSRAYVPEFAPLPLTKSLGPVLPEANRAAPGFGRKAVIYATCFGNFNDHAPGKAAAAVLAHNGVELALAHPGCCGMPKFENGDIEGVVAQAEMVTAGLLPYIVQGYDVVALTPSCALMLKFEWALMLPDHQGVKQLAQSTFDLSEYVVDIAKRHGLVDGLQPLDGGVAVHFACHARSQNMGPKAVEMLKLIPDTKPALVERCSGHGGKWGMFKQNFETAIKVGKPAGKALAKSNPAYVVSECPLAGPHLKQVMQSIDASTVPERIGHPIELMAKAYGFEGV
jgi:glycerol-3-phosphate dehydrogenase subunit C